MSASVSFRLTLAVASLIVLAGCASGPASNITLIPDTTDQLSSQDGLFAQTAKWKRSKPGCKGECPTLEVSTLVFVDQPQLTQLIDHGLAVMTGVNDSTPAPYDTIEEFEGYYWKVAGSRDSVVLASKLRYRSAYLTVVELDSWQYFTGAAHGIGATQFLNWDNARRAVIPLEAVLQPGAGSAFDAALQRAHARWAAEQKEVQADPQAWNRLWPFVPTDNFALTDQGVVVKYNTYEIAPYYFGQPEFTVPYAELKGILRPEYLPVSVLSLETLKVKIG